MKTLIQFVGLLFTGFLMSSCIASLHPIYDDDNLVHDPGLDGRWVSAEKNEAFLKPQHTNMKKDSAVQFEFVTTQMKKDDDTFEKSLYVMKSFEEDTAEFYVHMAEINEEKYLDFFIKSFDFDNNMAEFCLYPVHAFCKMERTADTLKLLVFDVRYIQKLIRDRKIKMPVEVNKGVLLLTASTEELQKFLAKYGKEPELYNPKPEIYFRQK